MTAWARIAQENSEQSCGNDGAMESQHQAFHISLGISQKNARFPHSHSSGDGLFDWTKKDSKKTDGRLHKSLDTANLGFGIGRGEALPWKLPEPSNASTSFCRDSFAHKV